MIACDFLTVETILLRRFYVLFFIAHADRRVWLAGCTRNPTGEWVTQQARNLGLDFSDRGVRFLIRDRDSKYSNSFDEVFRSEGIRHDERASARLTGCRMSWAPSRVPRFAFPPHWVGTTVRWDVEASEAGTTVDFRHAGFGDDVEAGLVASTCGQIMSRLTQCAETGRPDPVFV